MPRPRSSSPRDVALAAMLLGAALFFGWYVHRFYAIQAWLFWRYAAYSLSATACAVGCFGVGHAVVTRLLGRCLPFYAHVSVSFATGVYAFGVATFLLGVAQLYAAPLFALPLLFVAISARATWSYAFERWRRVRALRSRAPDLGRARLFDYALVGLGLLALGALYFIILTPENVAYDARWKHLALAEDFVVSGGIRRFPEGWTFATRPHFSTYLYTWAFLFPGNLFDRIEVAAHLEMALFAVTTWFSIPAIAKAVLPKQRLRWGIWATRFAFPGVFVYDSTLGCGADHVGAVFAGPIVLLTVLAWRRLELKYLVLLALQLAAAWLVKYTAVILLVVAPTIALGCRALWLLGQDLRSKRTVEALDLLRRCAIAVGAVALFSAPLWLKNAILYGDPLYPVLHAYFPSDPWFERADYAFEEGYLATRMWRPSRDLEGVKATLEALYTFSFVPNDWINHHKDVPVFGSLFTLLTPCLLLARGVPKRLWALVAVSHAALIPWYWLNHQDRYLQTLMPWMAAATAVMIVVLWRSHGRVVRVGVVALVGMQLVWGADAYFYQTQVFIGSPQKYVLGLLEAGYRGSRGNRFATQKPWPEIGSVIPEGSVVLLHDADRHLGLGHQAVMDLVPWQFGIDYGAQRTPAEVHDLLTEMRVTHIYWPRSRRYDTENLAADLMFLDFVHNRAELVTSFDHGHVARMPEARPDGPFDDATVAVTCAEPLSPGLYRAADLWVTSYGRGKEPYPAPRVAAANAYEATQLLPHAHFAVTEPRCLSALVGPEADAFDRAMRRRYGNRHNATFDIWVRRAEVPHRPHRALAVAD